MSDRRPLEDLVRRARRRIVRRLVAAELAFAGAVAMAGLIALLVLGTQILEWYWLAVLFGGSLAWGLYRTLRRVPSAYHVARNVDRGLGLEDSLSTAYHFLNPPGSLKVSPDVRDAQRRHAEELARGADVKQALPLGVPRGLRAAGLLGLVAFGLFALRYGLTHSLDLRPPIARASFDVFSAKTVESAGLPKPRPPRPGNEPIPAIGMTADERAAKHDSRQSLATEPGEAEASSVPGDALRKAEGLPTRDAADEQAEASSSEPAPNADSSPAAEGDNAAPSSPRKQNAKSGENSDLLNKLRDAMADLLSRLKIKPPSSGEMQTAEGKGDTESRQRQGKGQKGPPGASREDMRADANAEQEAGEESEGAESRDKAAGKPGRRSADTAASRKERSGVGKEEGDKEIREAQQLEAMGKISEIFGKRAENLKGEVTVEVSSGDQQLKTPYSQSAAAHSDTGGEIHRDEVPLIYQQYVQQYFEQVRKLPPPR